MANQKKRKKNKKKQDGPYGASAWWEELRALYPDVPRNLIDAAVQNAEPNDVEVALDTIIDGIVREQ